MHTIHLKPGVPWLMLSALALLYFFSTFSAIMLENWLLVICIIIVAIMHVAELLMHNLKILSLQLYPQGMLKIKYRHRSQSIHAKIQGDSRLLAGIVLLSIKTDDMKRRTLIFEKKFMDKEQWRQLQVTLRLLNT